MYDEVICFGAGELVVLYVDFLNYYNIKVIFIADNNEKKWGVFVNGIEVKSPQAVMEVENPILITCSYAFHEDIWKQLQACNVEKRICNIYDIITMRKIGFLNLKSCHNPFTTIIFDVFDNNKWAGTEMWSLRLANKLVSEEMKSVIFIADDMQDTEEKEKTEIRRFKRLNVIQQMVEYMQKNLPIVVVNSFCKYGLLAAMILKNEYPDKVKIISAVHNDEYSYYMRHLQYIKSVDIYFCVSKKIKKIAKKIYTNKKILFNPQPVDYEKEFCKKHDSCLRIGYAARLQRQQKRADLLPVLIDRLEQLHVNYIFEIAGSGELFNCIFDYIKKNNLEQKVILLGQISPSKMKEFWKKQDVFVNLSEYEGCSLSMLEAMSYGCVPIVTDVSGVREVVNDGENGFICNIDDVEKMAYHIAELKLEKVARMGELSRASILQKCNYEKYIDYWEKLLCSI